MATPTIGVLCHRGSVQQFPSSIVQKGRLCLPPRLGTVPSTDSRINFGLCNPFEDCCAEIIRNFAIRECRMKSTVLKPRDVYAALKIIAANSRRGPEAWPPFRAAAKAVLKVKKSDMPPSPFGKSGKKRKSQKPRRANQLFFSHAGGHPT